MARGRTSTGPGSDEPGAEVRSELPAHVTTPLLVRLTQQSLDEDYEHVARRNAERAESGVDAPESGPGAARRRAWVIVSLVVLGLLCAVAAVQSSRNADVEELGRTALITRIQGERAQVRTTHERASDLRDEVDALQTRKERLGPRQQSVDEEIFRVAGLTGFGPVRGPGITITIDDTGVTEQEGRIRDSDLAQVVDGLWTAGAEAIAINDQRLTARSPIRNTGRTVQVNQRPLRAPYVVSAIGNRQQLEADWVNTVQGAEFLLVAGHYKIQVSRRDAAELLLPAAPQKSLRHVKELSGDSDTPEGSAS